MTLGDLLRSPSDRERTLDVVPLVLVRDGDQSIVDPGAEVVMRSGDVLLLAAGAAARRAVTATMTHPPTAAYVVEGRAVPATSVWRWLTRTQL